jgi:hypothetical protein
VSQVNNCCGDFANCYRPCEVRRTVALPASRKPRAIFVGMPAAESGLIDLRTAKFDPALAPRATPPKPDTRLPFRIAMLLAIALLVVDLLARAVRS